MSDVAASGGYYIAAGAKQIIASPNTITGSIGGIRRLPRPSAARWRGSACTWMASAPRRCPERRRSIGRCRSPPAGCCRAWSTTPIRIFSRSSPRDAVSRSTASTPSPRDTSGPATDALRIGLVDRLGNYEDALQEAATRAGLKAPYGVRRIEPDLSWMDQLLLQLHVESARVVARVGVVPFGAGQAGPNGWLAPLMPFEQALGQELARWARLSSPNGVYAYCFLQRPVGQDRSPSASVATSGARRPRLDLRPGGDGKLDSAQAAGRQWRQLDARIQSAGEGAQSGVVTDQQQCAGIVLRFPYHLQQRIDAAGITLRARSAGPADTRGAPPRWSRSRVCAARGWRASHPECIASAADAVPPRVPAHAHARSGLDRSRCQRLRPGLLLHGAAAAGASWVRAGGVPTRSCRSASLAASDIMTGSRVARRSARRSRR